MPIERVMSRRTLTVLIVILFALLVWMLFVSERGLTGVLEQIGALIFKLFT